MFLGKYYRSRERLYLATFIFLHFILLLKIKFTAWPEMLAWPHLIVNGWVPYRDIAIAHTPLLLIDLSLFNAIFGVGLLQLKIYTWILIILTDILIYYIVKNFWNRRAALFVLIIYIPLQILYEGNGLWFDLALAPLALLIYYSLKRSQYLWSGIWFALAVLTKQTAVWFIFPVLFYITKEKGLKNPNVLMKKFLSFATGFIIPIIIFLSVLVVLGLQEDFYQWAVKFGMFYLPKAEGQVLFPGLKQLVASFFPFSILASLLFWKKTKIDNLGMWTVFGLLGIYPRFELFHFQPALPFLAIVTAFLADRWFGQKIKVSTVLPLCYLIIVSALFLRFIIRDWGGETRFFTGLEKNVAAHTLSELGAKKEIYVLNYWDSLYAMTDTFPTTKPLIPYIPWYLEYDNLKKSVYNDLRDNMPAVIVKGEYSRSGLGSYAVVEIDELLDEHYILSFKNENVLIYKVKE